MRSMLVLGTLCACLSMAGCDKVQKLFSSGSPNKESPQSAAPASTSPAQGLPDVGKLATEKVTAQGFGASPAEAVDEAIHLAIKQVNGAAVDMSSTQVKISAAIAVGRDVAALRASAFADVVQQQSGGVVTNFRLVNLDEPGPLTKSFKATIEANVAKFVAPADSKKIKIVVGPIRVDTASYQVGGVSVQAVKVAESVRAQILNALANTGRFVVLDREFGGALEQELDMIGTGQTPSAELAKLSQANSADLIWTGRISAFSYRNNDEVTGGWTLSQRVVNVATRQIQISDILKGEPPKNISAADKVQQAMEGEVVSRVVSAILNRTFPITVASREGNNVVLSQGGQSVREGARYRLVSLGQEVRDPQTGQSLGRMEYDCCEVIIDKVLPTLSQGHLENVRMPLDQVQPGGLQVREYVAVVKNETGDKKKKTPAKDIFADDKGKW